MYVCVRVCRPYALRHGKAIKVVHMHVFSKAKQRRVELGSALDLLYTTRITDKLGINSRSPRNQANHLLSSYRCV
jgi:hypothetical protein